MKYTDKKPYEVPEMNIVLFNKEDILSTSGGDASDPDDLPLD